MNWKPGDRAIIVKVAFDGANAAGHYCELVRFAGTHPIVKQGRICPNAWVCVLDDGRKLYIAEMALRPIPDDNETTTWEAVEDICGWRPREIVHERNA